jgi:hypothetical protein
MKVAIPMTMAAAIPTKAAALVIPVAVTRWDVGNQMHDNTGGTAPTGPAKPLIICPMFMVLQIYCCINHMPENVSVLMPGKLAGKVQK